MWIGCYVGLNLSVLNGPFYFIFLIKILREDLIVEEYSRHVWWFTVILGGGLIAIFLEIISNYLTREKKPAMPLVFGAIFYVASVTLVFIAHAKHGTTISSWYFILALLISFPSSLLFLLPISLAYFVTYFAWQFAGHNLGLNFWWVMAPIIVYSGLVNGCVLGDMVKFGKKVNDTD